jgi:uncharacterized repeat protein (TIGR01451 family)
MNFHKQGAVMKNSIPAILMTIFSTLGLAVFAHAQEQDHLDVNTTVQKEMVTVNAAGEENIELVPVGTVTPGERVIYTITFRNIGAEPADNVVITNPIDQNLTYADGTAFGPGTAIEFSVDGGATYADQSELTVTEDGVSRAANAADFTDIRWVMQGELAVGAQGVVRFTAELN